MKYSTHILIAVLAVGQVTTLVSAQEALAPASKTTVDPSGTWRREYDWYDTRIKEVIRLNLKEDGKVVGTLSRNDAASEIKNAKLKGNELSFSVSNDYQGTAWVTNYTGIIKGDEIDGTVVLQVGDQSWDFAWRPKRSVQMDDVVGTWQIHIESPDGNVLEPTMKISKDGDKYKSVYKNTQGQELDIKDLRVEKNTLKFTVTAEFDGGSIKVDYQGRPYGDKISGSLDYDFGGNTGQAEFTARRKQIYRFRNGLPLAFPGAEGAGKFTKGGRGGDVYHVTNLKDSGPGSLREGIESIKGPRTIVFDVGGMVRLKDELVIKDKSYLTIAGQTAPGKGITLADQSLQIKESKHIIVRYLRVRLGDENKPAGSGPDCITVDYCDHIILDHLSLSWGIDGNGDFRGLKHVTLQWLIFSEALHDSLHGKGSHGMCSSFRDTQGPATMHHNIYASSRQRHPTINGGSDVVEFCNNLDYNWENGHNLSGDKFNLIGNYYKAGPSMRAGFRPIQLKTGKKPPTSQGYFAGNHFEGLPEEYNKDNYSAMDFKASGLGFTHAHSYQDTTREKFEVSERFDAGKYKLTGIESAKDAYESCLKYSGCSLVRDTVDERFIKTITDNSGKIIDSQNDVGGWDPYPPIHRPDNWDTDGDGMPDAWERTVGFDPDNAADGNEDRNSDGYTNVEEYLNSLTPHGL